MDQVFLNITLSQGWAVLENIYHTSVRDVSPFCIMLSYKAINDNQPQKYIHLSNYCHVFNTNGVVVKQDSSFLLCKHKLLTSDELYFFKKRIYMSAKVLAHTLRLYNSIVVVLGCKE